MTTKSVSLPLLKDVPVEAWEKLAQKRIFFAHRSVGFNIVEGMKDVVSENHYIKMEIVESDKPDQFKPPIFAHAKVGENKDPLSKIQGFVDYVKSGVGNAVDIAFFKFCFVDIDQKTDVQKLINIYDNAMSTLRTSYPNVKFIHTTVPYTIARISLRSRLKELLRMNEIWEYDVNIKKNEFNELVKVKYFGKEPIFDLAQIESTLSDGTRTTFTKYGKLYYSLAPQYTNDGGHLNEYGRKVVAEQLLVMLAHLSQ